MPGVDMREEAQLGLLPLFGSFVEECRFPTAATSDPLEFHLSNEYFESFDAEVLHTFIRHFRPKTVIEIGSGHSTLAIRGAMALNRADGSGGRIISIEPYPDPLLQNATDQLIVKPVEQISWKLFDQLQPNDILFIDSSHTVKIGGDVLYEYLEILPRLRPGVLVHVHDVFLPHHYPRHWVIDEHKFWSEQYLLQAFLTFNNAFEVIWASSFMSGRHTHRLRRLFPQWGAAAAPPSSFWMRSKTV
jgi:hypothetical protein